MTIQIVKLITGEEIIGDVNLSGDYTIKKPCVVQLVASRQDPTQPMISLIPYAFFTEEHSITVPVNFIVWVSKPVKELYNQYNNLFGSGIQLAGV